MFQRDGFTEKNLYFSFKTLFSLATRLIQRGEMTRWIIQLFAFSQFDRRDIATDVIVTETRRVVSWCHVNSKWPSGEALI